MSAIPGKTTQDFTAVVDAVPQGQSSLDIANTRGIFRTLSGKTYPAAEESEIVQTATERLNNWNFARDYSQFWVFSNLVGGERGQNQGAHRLDRQCVENGPLGNSSSETRCRI